MPNIIVCGHGGTKATIEGGNTVAVDRWLDTTRDVPVDHCEEIEAHPDLDAKLNRLVEYNSRDQLLRLARTPTIATAPAERRCLMLRGRVYDVRNGWMKPTLMIAPIRPSIRSVAPTRCWDARARLKVPEGL